MKAPRGPDVVSVHMVSEKLMGSNVDRGLDDFCQLSVVSPFPIPLIFRPQNVRSETKVCYFM